MYNLLELNNFRCFKKFSMELKPITLIAGKNNTGKSSILDGLFLFQNYANPDAFINLLGFRDMKSIDTSASTVWSPLFYNMNTQETIKICLNDKYSLRLEKNDAYALSSNDLGILNGKVDFSSANYALSCNFERERKQFIGDYMRSNEKLNHNLVLLGRNNVSIQANDEFIQYLGPHISLDDITVADLFGQIELSQNKTDKNKLIDVLGILDEGIVDIKTIAASGLVQLYFTDKKGVTLPIHTKGDGIRKLLHIALVLLTKPGCILLLDEVENGLHYSLHAKFWEMISTLAVQEKCQVIATTHSYECISGALEGVKAATLEDSFAYTRLDRNENGISPKTFTSDMLERALDSDWEVR
ncbi:MAG: ATP-binding protein [Firmicutes bacterium]|nr:ATP-binding protein [Bacillota bacterium]